MIIKSVFLISFSFVLTSCSTRSQDATQFLFPQAKQKHIVAAYGSKGELNSRSENYLILDGEMAKLTSLSPGSLTMIKATLHREAPADLLFLSPHLEKQRPLIQELLKRLSKLLWITSGKVPSDVKVLEKFEDGAARILEWRIRDQRILIEVVLI